jgi:hypothetical protein
MNHRGARARDYVSERGLTGCEPRLAGDKLGALSADRLQFHQRGISWRYDHAPPAELARGSSERSTMITRGVCGDDFRVGRELQQRVGRPAHFEGTDVLKVLTLEQYATADPRIEAREAHHRRA